MEKEKNQRLLELTIEYRNDYAKEKLRRIRLQNDTKEFELEKKKESICYRQVALMEFERAIGCIYAQIRNASEQLTSLLRLDTSQSDILHDYMDGIMQALSEIDLDLSTTQQFDAEHYFDGKARRAQALKG